jgi:uncharacterized lipoprotein YbaY
MKGKPILPLSLALAACLAAGCSHLDLTPQDDPDRVLDGTIELSTGAADLPEDAVVLVRVVDAVTPSTRPLVTAADPIMKRPVPPPDMPAEVLGEQTIRHPSAYPIPFHIQYRAAADQLRQGLNVEARISYGGRVRFVNLDHYAIGLNDYTLPKLIRVEPSGR